MPMKLEQYTVVNNTNIILYLNSMEIKILPNDKRWFYLDVFDCRYILSPIGFLTIGHKYDKLVIEGAGQLSYKVDQINGIVYVYQDKDTKNFDAVQETYNEK